MKSWLAYSGAFAIAMAASAICYVGAFRALMSGAGSGIAGFVLLAVVLPVAAGLVTFGFSYFAFTQQRFDLAGWAIGLAFVAAATAACFGLVVADVIEELPATLLLLASLFVGGRVLTQRGRHD